MERSATWENWSGSVVATPRAVHTPTTEGDVRAIIARSRGELRVAGTGHSFVPLCATTGTLLSLDNLQGIITADQRRGAAMIWAGSKIHQLGEPLLQAGLALANQGDIDRQSFAGALSTGTHGTGATLGNMSTQAVGLRLVLASGDRLDISETDDPDLLQATRVSLGLLGVITRLTVRALPAYRLHERTWVASVDECLDRLPALIAGNRHFEFFWSPRDDACAMKALNVTSEPIGVVSEAVESAGRLSRYLKPERVDWSYRIFPSSRDVRFNEMEFALPAEAGPTVFQEVRTLMQRQFPEVVWPIEYRTLAADEGWLSPAYRRDSVTISVHQAADLRYQDFFASVEAICRNVRGRPHWGKLHQHGARDFRDLYPAWDRFQVLRERLDPTGRFLNDYLRRVMLDR